MKFACLMVLLSLVLLVTLLACQPPVSYTPATLAQADARAGDIAAKVSAAATQVSGSAGEIVSAAGEGRARTPEAVRPTLDPFWIRILANGQVLLRQGDALGSVRQDIDTLRTEVQAGKKQMEQALADLAAEKDGRAKDNAAWQKKLDAANSQWERMFRTVSWLAIVAIGISVAVGLLLHDFRISIAGGAGGGAMLLACMLAGQIQHWLPWVAGGLVAVVMLWVIVETYLRGSFAAAVKTNPVQDLQDLFHSAPAPAPSLAAPVGPTQ